MNNDFILDIIARLNKQLSKKSINNDLKTLDNKFYVKVLAKLSKSLAQRELKKSLKELNNLYVNVGTKVKVDKNTKTKLEQDVQNLRQTIADLEVGLKASKLQQEKLNADIEAIRKNAQKKINSEPLEFNLQIKKDKLISDIQYTGKRFSKLFTSDSASRKYESIMQNALSVSNKQQLADTRAELAAFNSELKVSGLNSMSVGDRFKNLTSRFRDLFSAATIIHVAFEQLQNSVKTTVELDKAYTDLIKVQEDLTRNDYPDYLKQCNKKAQELATTQKALIEGATEFSKSGYDLDTSDKLTEKSTILSNVGEMSASDSAKAIISGVQAYDEIDGYTDVVDKAQALIDKYNELGNVSSITTAELAQGVQSVGSVFADANTDVNQFLSLLSSGNRAYQNADSLALALRTSALRIRGASVELEEAGEDIEGVMSKLDNQKAIKALTGVDILEKDQETIRSIYDIFLDISKVYKDMSDTDQSALLELIAGKHRASAISATLNNMTEAEELLQKSLNSAGSAQKEYDTHLDSTEAHINQFKAKLTETYTELMNGKTISFISDVGTALLDIVNKFDLIRHSLIAIGTIKIGQGISTLGGVIASTAKEMNTLGTAIEKVKNLPLDETLRTDTLKEVGEATKNLTEKNLKLLLSQKQLEDEDKIAILTSQEMTREQALEKLETMGLTKATKANTVANATNATSVNTLKGTFVGLRASIKATWAAMSTLQKASVILTVISTAYSIVSSIIDGCNQKQEEARQKTIETSNAAIEQANNLQEVYTKYKQLSSIQNRTEAQENEYKTVVEEVTKALGDKASALKDLKEGTEQYNQTLDEMTKKEFREAYNNAKAGRTAAEKELKNIDINGWDVTPTLNDLNDNSKIVIPYAYKFDSEETFKALEKVKKDLSKYLLDDQGNQLIYGVEDDDIDKIIDFYSDMKKSLESLKEYEDMDLTQSKAYDVLNSAYSKAAEGMETYTEQQYEMLKYDYLYKNGIPETAEEFENMKESILNASGAGDEYKKVLENLLNMDFSDMFNGVDEATDKLKSTSNSISDIFALENSEGKETQLGKLSSELDEIQNAYATLSELTDSYEENGAISIDQLQNLLALGDNFLDYLVNEEGNLRTDTEAMQQLASARLDEMKVKIQQGIIDNVMDIQNEADATKYLASTNYALADSIEAVTRKNLDKWKADAIVNRNISAEKADEVYNKAVADLNKTDKLFSKIDISHDSLSGGNKNKSNNSKSKKQIDFVEYRFKELDEVISKVEAHIENFNGASSKNAGVDSLIKINTHKQSDIEKSISLYQSMADELFNKIPQKYREAAKNGAIAVTDFIETTSDDNKTIAETIEEYRSLSDKVGDYETQLIELNKTLRELEKRKFDNILNDYEKQLDIITSSTDKLNSLIDLQQNQYGTTGKGLYEELIKQTNTQLKYLKEEKAALQSQMSQALNNGIKVSSDEWKDMQSAISDIDSEIINCTSSLEEFQNSINQLEWDTFDSFMDRVNDISDELSNLSNLFEEETLIDDKAGWTTEGIAALGLYAQGMENAAFKSAECAKELEKLDAEYQKGTYTLSEYLERQKDLKDSQYEAIDNYNSEKEAIAELYRERIDKQIEAIEEKTEAYRELVDKQKEYLDNLLKEKETKDRLNDAKTSVEKVQAQIDAMSGDTSDAGIAKRLQFEEELSEKRKELDDLNYENTINSRIEALDKSVEALEENNQKEIDKLEELKEDTEAIVEEVLNFVLSHTKEVLEGITTVADKYSIQVSDSITTPWLNGENSLNHYDDTLSVKTSAFIDKLNRIKENTYNVQTQADMTAEQLITTFSVSSEILESELLRIQSELSSDYDKSVQLYNSINDVFSANNLDNSTILGKLQEVAGGLDNVTCAAIGAADEFEDMKDMIELFRQSAEIAGEVANRTIDIMSSKVSDLTTNLTNAANKGAELGKQLAQNVENAPANITESHGYKIINMTTGEVIDDLGMVLPQTANVLLKKQQSRYPLQPLKLQAYAKGGVVKKDNNPLNPIAKSIGEDVMVAAKQGEALLDIKQTAAMTNIADHLPELAKLVNLQANISSPFTHRNMFPEKKKIENININGGDIVVEGNLDNVTLKEVGKLMDKKIQTAFDIFTRAATR